MGRRGMGEEGVGAIRNMAAVVAVVDMGKFFLRQRHEVLGES